MVEDQQFLETACLAGAFCRIADLHKGSYKHDMNIDIIGLLKCPKFRLEIRDADLSTIPQGTKIKLGCILRPFETLDSNSKNNQRAVCFNARTGESLKEHKWGSAGSLRFCFVCWYYSHSPACVAETNIKLRSRGKPYVVEHNRFSLGISIPEKLGSSFKILHASIHYSYAPPNANLASRAASSAGIWLSEGSLLQLELAKIDSLCPATLNCSASLGFATLKV
ncbi:hypothetical protein WA026_017245 [Henosepilachna vigintioctopunctata]|uniref:Uncharacterized protein n=1 Tax=Henosepilachna vigintioctopunctata TaxID=420089 RepID=A0AAW1UDJ1_9CUCU